MWRDARALIAERKHIKRELALLYKRQLTLERKQFEIARKADATADDTEALSELKIATNQMAEAHQMNDRLIAHKAKRLKGVEKTIAILKQSEAN